MKQKEMQKDKEIANLTELCEKFDMNRFKTKLQTRVTACLDELELLTNEFKDKEN